jgi:hypothetical protein
MALPLAAGLGIAVVTYLVRVWPRIGLVDYGTDTYFHLKLACVIRKERNRQNFARYFSIGNHNDYPLLFHYLLAVLPKEFLERANGYISPFFDVLSAVLLYWFSYVLTGEWRIGIIAWFFYLMTPQLSLEALSLTPRLLGVFFFNFWIAAMIMFVRNGAAIWAVAAVASGALCFFEIRFQLPFMLTVGFLLWALTGKCAFAALEAAVFATAFILNREQFIRTFQSYWIMTSDGGRHWRFYGDDQDRLSGVFRKTGKIEYRRHADLMKKELRMLFSYNPASWLMLAAGYWLVAMGHGRALSEAKMTLWVWFLMSFVTFLLAQRFPQFGQRGGDGYRQYPMFGMIPGTILLGAAVFESSKTAPIFCATLAAGGLFCAFLTLRMTSKGFKNKLKESFACIAPELKSILKKAQDYPWGGVMCLPHTYNYTMIYFGDKRVVDTIERSRPYRRLHSTFIVKLELSLDEYIRLFDLDYFFVNTSLPFWSRDTSAVGEVVEKEGPFIFVRIFPEVKRRLMESSPGNESDRS